MRYLILIFAIILLSFESPDQLKLSAEGTGVFWVQYTIDNQTTILKVSDRWEKIIQVQPGDIIILGAKANGRAVNIEAGEMGAAVMPYQYNEIIYYNLETF